MKLVREQRVLWHAKIDMPMGRFAPDSFSGSAGAVPPNNFVVARDRMGRPVSFFGDPVWDYTAYHPRESPSRLHFRPWNKRILSFKQKRLVGEVRWIMWNLIYKRHGSSLSVSTMSKCVFALNAVAKWACDHEKRVEDCLSDPMVLRNLLQDNPKWVVIKQLPTILASLIEIGEIELGFQPVGGKSLAELRALKFTLNAKYKQHPPLPRRIYTEFIGNMLHELSEINSVIHSIQTLVRQACEWHKGRPPSKTVSKNGNLRPIRTGESDVIKDLIEKYGLVTYFNTRSLRSDRFGLISCLTDIQRTCQYILHIFSGARRDEIAHLPYQCIDTRRNFGQVDYLLRGATTKLNNGRLKPSYWVTSKDGEYAVRVARKIADIIYEYLGQKPDKHGPTDRYPLFVSIAHLPFSNRTLEPPRKGGRVSVSNTKRDSIYLHDGLIPKMQREDLHELKQIDPHRAWSSEVKFKVGERWPLTTHQLRRSLALYASNSGIVSLPSLRRQLQHITEGMSRYYARGSLLAKKIIGGDKDHFGSEWQETQSEAQAMAYIATALFSDERLFGAHGVYVERLKARKEDLMLLKDRDRTIKLFKKGQLAYKETFLGGCMESGQCDKRALRSIVGCIDCGKAILIPRKVRLVVAAQKAQVETLERNTVEYRQEAHDLKILTSVLKKMEEARQ